MKILRTGNLTVILFFLFSLLLAGSKLGCTRKGKSQNSASKNKVKELSNRDKEFIIVNKSSYLRHLKNLRGFVKKLGNGLYFRKVVKNGKEVYFLEINPSLYSFDLMLAKDRGDYAYDIKTWVKMAKAVAGINAGMYCGDGSHCGYVKYRDRVYSNFVKSYRGNFAFDRKAENLPFVKFFSNSEFKVYAPKYHTVVQNMRLVWNGKNYWGKKKKMYSISALGDKIDRKGREWILFIFTRDPWIPHDFNNFLIYEKKKKL